MYGSDTYVNYNIVRELTRELRSSSTCNLKIPLARTTSYGDRAFSSAEPKLWNELPPEIRNAPTFPIFNTMFKTHLFRKFQISLNLICDI